MDVIKSSRFWISIALIAAVTVLAALKTITGAEALSGIFGLLGGFGVAKAAPGSATSGQP